MYVCISKITFPIRFDLLRPAIDNNAKLGFEKTRPSRMVVLVVRWIVPFSLEPPAHPSTIHWPYYQVLRPEQHAYSPAASIATCCSFRYSFQKLSVLLLYAVYIHKYHTIRHNDNRNGVHSTMSFWRLVFPQPIDFSQEHYYTHCMCKYFLSNTSSL